MAINFLEASARYLDSFTSESGRKKLLRRSIIVKYLKGDYTTSFKENGKKILADLKLNGIASTPSTVGRDIELYQLTYNFLHGERETAQRKSAKEGEVIAKTLRCLIEDGIDSWEQAVSLYDQRQQARALQLADPEKKDEKKETGDVQVTEEEPVSRGEIIPSREECSDDEDEALERRKEVLGKAVDDIYELFLGFSTENMALKDETRELRKQLQEKESALLGQGEEIQLLESSKALFVKIAEQAEACLLELEDAEKLLALADRNIDELEKYVDVLESELLAFQDKKAILTEIHQLTAIFIPDLEPSMPEIATVTVNGDSHVRPALPVECNYYERPFFYSRKFMKVFEGLEKSDKVAIMESLEHYSQGGPGYSSLRSKKQEGCRKKGTIKGGEIKSRAGKFFRFSWEVKAEAVHITGLTRKSNIIE